MLPKRLLLLLALAGAAFAVSLLLPGTPAAAQPTVIATISIEGMPWGVAVDATTDRIYVAAVDKVSVIDGSTNEVIAAVPVGRVSVDVAVNPQTGRAYVSNYGSNSVSVIDAATNEVIATIPVDPCPTGVVGNPVTNRIYVGTCSENVSVIDGLTNTVISTIRVWLGATHSLAVNPTTNRIYVLSSYQCVGCESGWESMITVVDGTTDSVVGGIDFPGLSDFGALAVNPATNRVYAATWSPDALWVIDGATNEVIGIVPVGPGAEGVGVNPTSNRIYVAHLHDDNVSVIDGATNTLLRTVPVGNGPLSVAANPATNRIYVTNIMDGTVSVIEDIAAPPPDTDGDGILDADDDCPDTPAEATVDENGCFHDLRVAFDRSLIDAQVPIRDTESVVLVADVGNLGQVASEATVYVSLPPQLLLDSEHVAAGQGFCSLSSTISGGTGVTCNLGALQPGASTAVAIEPMTPCTPANLSMTVSASVAASMDFQSGNNDDAVSFQILSGQRTLDPAASTVEASPARLSAGMHSLITVRLVDTRGKPFCAGNVELVSYVLDLVIDPPSGSTDQDGVFRALVSSSVPGFPYIGALVDGVEITQKAMIEFVDEDQCILQFPPVFGQCYGLTETKFFAEELVRGIEAASLLDNGLSAAKWARWVRSFPTTSTDKLIQRAASNLALMAETEIIFWAWRNQATALANDPADDDYTQVAELGPVAPIQPVDDSPYSVARARYLTTIAQEAAILEVVTTTLERLQGAIAAGEPPYVLLQAEALEELLTLLRQNLQDQRRALLMVSAEFDALYGPIQEDLQLDLTRLATDGFNDEERHLLLSVGLTPGEILSVEEIFGRVQLAGGFHSSVLTALEDRIALIDGRLIPLLDQALPLVETSLDPDDDDDGILDSADNCALVANPDQLDTDADGMGNACDPDDDNDGLLDSHDACSLEDSTGFDANNDGCIDRITDLGAFFDTLFEEGAIDSTMHTSLHAKIDAAVAASTRVNVCAAVNVLDALKNQIHAQTGKRVSEDAAPVLLEFITNVQNYMLIGTGVGSC